ncbi:MAG: glycosyltransferase family 2 protein [Pseudomonadota bacterium]
MKLIIQIPCLNEAATLASTIAALPKAIDGIERIEVLVIDDGSDDETTAIAAAAGASVVRHRGNRGLAHAFQTGVDHALRAGADVIVNTDADGQYHGADVAQIVAPIVAGEADIVVGDRGVAGNAHFSPLKRRLQRIGSGVVSRLSQNVIPDAVSGFRAISREAAEKIFIASEFSYTTDMLIQAGRKRMRILSVPIRTNPPSRPSRLFRSTTRFIARTGMTIARTYTMYNPLRVFGAIGVALALIGLAPIIRFLVFALQGDGQGHVQSLILGAALLILGAVAVLFGMLADLVSANRKLSEAALERLRRLEARLDAEGAAGEGEQAKIRRDDV